MTEVDLTSMSLEDLKSLRTKVNRAIDTFEDRRRKEALAAADAKAREFGFSISELLDSGKKGAPPPRPPKYRHPENPDLTWTGRGRQPQWFKDAVEAGTDPDELLISA
ncbi:H-NS histone family protein [Meridianimarinicoccus sp. RP-17]|uniref:H-NS histone family protein n=1 Tax=Meridianimarinicoccus zhengii TaxID=2056810 RepID=UPI000DAE9020|nr:H-NS histone family protein [Phycocomes zhengii]